MTWEVKVLLSFLLVVGLPAVLGAALWIKK